MLTKIAAPATERIVFPSIAAPDALDSGIAVPLPALCAAADAWVLQIIALHPELLVVEPQPRLMPGAGVSANDGNANVMQAALQA